MLTNNHEIIRVDKTAGNFAVMHKGFLSDDRLSFKAKGILAYCLSKHDSWKVVVGDLVKRSTDGKAAVITALRELKICGYYEKSPVRDAAGRIVCWEGIIREVSVPIETDDSRNVDNHVDKCVDNQPQADFQHQEKQEMDKPVHDKPVLENPVHENQERNNNDFNNNDISNNDLKPHPNPNPAKTRFAECVCLTQKEHETLVERIGADGADWCIQKLDAYKRQTGRRYKSDFAAMENWVIARWEEHVKTSAVAAARDHPRAVPLNKGGRERKQNRFNNYSGKRVWDYEKLAALERQWLEKRASE